MSLAVGCALLICLVPAGCDGQTGPLNQQPSTLAGPPAAQVKEAAWPRFRGPGGLGVSGDRNTPVAWNGSNDKMENILWKSPVPLPGHSSPVVWGDRVFITGYDGKDNRGHVICYHADTGALLWQRKVERDRTPDFTPPKDLFDVAVGAASTMALDGRRAYAIFANGDLAAYDFEGNPVWSRHLGVPVSLYGYASSLAVFKNLLLVQYDQAAAEEDEFISKLFAFRGDNGELAWEADRPVVDSWTSPIVIESSKGSQLITLGTPWYIAYDPTDGRELWKVYMEGSDMAPSPAYAKGLVIALVPNYDMCAIRIDGTGDVTESHIAWVNEGSIPDVASPAASDELVFLACSGLLTCCELESGQTVWEHEFDSEFQSSPTLVGDRLYLLGSEGTMFIVAPEREFKEIGRAELGESTSCSPAFVNNRIYIRGERSLFCVGEE